MFRIISLLAVTLLLTACDLTNNLNMGSENYSQSSSPTPLASSPTGQCQPGKIPASLKAFMGNYRLAQKSDFIAPIRNYSDSESPEKQFTCSFFTADFNEDGKSDYALLLVDPKTFKSQFQIAIAQENGKFQSAGIRNYDKPPKPIQGAIYTAMFFKPAGELGTAQRKYFPLVQGTQERTTFVSKPAIELWRPFIPNTPRAVKADPSNYDIDHLAYCSEVLYFVDGQVETAVVCD